MEICSSTKLCEEWVKKVLVGLCPDRRVIFFTAFQWPGLESLLGRYWALSHMFDRVGAVSSINKTLVLLPSEFLLSAALVMVTCHIKLIKMIKSFF